MALKDLERIEADSRYEYSPMSWHVAMGQSTEAPCKVCAAGAVLACRTPIGPRQGIEGRIPMWMIALDNMRQGYVAMAIGQFSDHLKMLEGSPEPGAMEPESTIGLAARRIDETARAMDPGLNELSDWNTSRESFRKRWRYCAEELERQGL